VADTRRARDIAYACFLFAGLVPLLIAVLSKIPMDTGTAGGVGLLLLVPLTMAAIVAVVIGVRHSVHEWRHWPLVVCSVFSALYLVVFLTEVGPEWFRNLLPIAYGLTTVVLALRWFISLRGRQGQHGAPS
jgi:hypothetical protein